MIPGLIVLSPRVIPGLIVLSPRVIRVYIPVSLLDILPYVPNLSTLWHSEALPGLLGGVTVNMLLGVNYPFHCWTTLIPAVSHCFERFCPVSARYMGLHGGLEQE